MYECGVTKCKRIRWQLSVLYNQILQNVSKSAENFRFFIFGGKIDLNQKTVKKYNKIALTIDTTYGKNIYLCIRKKKVKPKNVKI